VRTSVLDHATYAIVGGGVAAAAAVDGIRAADPAGDIALFTTEWAPPYQRPPLSKEFLRGEAPLESVLMHPALWYLQNGVDVRVGVTVTAIDPAEHTLHIDGQAIRYDKLLLATGATPQQLKIPGADLDGVYMLRTYEDALRLRAVRATAARVVLVGSGFIGMELAASLRSGGAEVVLTSVDKALWAMFGADVSGYVAGVFKRHGVQVILDNQITSFAGEGRVRSVATSRGTFDCDAVVIGIGVSPNVELAQAAGLKTGDGIIVDDHLLASAPDVYAAGDVARFPLLDGTLGRVEHFDNAEGSGRVAGGNMAGLDAGYRYVPFFWSDVFELGFEFVGTPAPESRIVTGTLESNSFVIEYIRDAKLAGAFLANRTSEESAAYRERIGDLG
jgi:3-phenylpropionate/trans-cinnamate dioxygenase ferredoxin reductase subunit